MRNFIDLHLKVSQDPEIFRQMLMRAVKLGYQRVAVTLSTPVLAQKLKEQAFELGLDLVSRIDLNPKNPGDLSRSLRKFRRRFEVVSVCCRNKQVARLAARDNRVDILNFPFSYSNRTRVWFDSQEASLASRSNCAYEINFVDLIIEDSMLTKMLSRLELEVANAKKCSVPIVVSSGTSNPALIREPRALVSILGIIGISEEEGLDMVSLNPNRIVETNRSKLYPNNVFREVREV